MVDKAWKRAERRIAEYIGGERVPITGRQRGSAPDIEHAWLSVECKYRAKLPEWLHDAMRQADASRKQRQMPIVFLLEKGAKVGDAYAVVRLSDFRDRWIS